MEVSHQFKKMLMRLGFTQILLTPIPLRIRPSSRCTLVKRQLSL